MKIVFACLAAMLVVGCSSQGDCDTQRAALWLNDHGYQVTLEFGDWTVTKNKVVLLHTMRDDVLCAFSRVRQEAVQP